jgi:broad specificity phosphatase PhoE
MNSIRRDRRLRRLRHGLAALLASCLLLLTLPPARAQAFTDTELIAALREGGYNLYFRHVATDWSQNDDLRKAGDWGSCDPARMRQLSAAGRSQASAIGAAMRRLQIPVSEVLASPYCRTVETARLMQLGDVVESLEVMNLRAANYVGGRDRVVATARALLASKPPQGGNRVIVAHGNVAREATPFYPGEGEALVFQPDGAGGFDLRGRIRPGDWARLTGLAE